jgi:hypothetical protein
LKTALTENRPTDDMREYGLYVQQALDAGESPMKFREWDIERSHARRTNVTQVNRGEDAYDKKMGEGFASDYRTYVGEGNKAFSTLGTLQLMKNATSDPNFYSGAAAEQFVLPLKQAISALGGDKDAAASMETFRGLANKAVLDSMGGSLGTGFSNADRDFVVGQVANLGNTPDGNRALIGISEKIERRKIDVARIAQEYVQRNSGRLDVGFDRELSEWREKNPLFSTEERADIKKIATESATANLPLFSDPGEARAKLKSGQLFRTPDNRVLEVP